MSKRIETLEQLNELVIPRSRAICSISSHVYTGARLQHDPSNHDKQQRKTIHFGKKYIH